MYRSTEKINPNFNRKHPMYDYFVNHQPAEWMKNLNMVNTFQVVFGEQAVVDLKQSGVIPEHASDPVWVGGTKLKSGEHAVRPVYGEGPKERPVRNPGPGEIVLETGFGTSVVNISNRRIGTLTVPEFEALMKKILGK